MTGGDCVDRLKPQPKTANYETLNLLPQKNSYLLLSRPIYLYNLPDKLQPVNPMTSKRKNQICTLLKGIKTGDASSVAVVNQDKYIQHNPQTHRGGEGLATLFKRLSKSNPRVNIVRVFEDDDYVFAHTEYDFASSNIGFEVFRFEGDQTVEHWDNIQHKQGPNSSGHTMVDGPTEATDLDKTQGYLY